MKAVKRFGASAIVAMIALAGPLLSGCHHPHHAYAAYPDYGPYWQDPWYYHHHGYYHHRHYDHHHGGIRATPFRPELPKAPGFPPSIPGPRPAPPRR